MVKNNTAYLNVDIDVEDNYNAGQFFRFFSKTKVHHSNQPREQQNALVYIEKYVRVQFAEFSVGYDEPRRT